MLIQANNEMLKFENNCGHVRIAWSVCANASGGLELECGLSQRRLAAQYPSGLAGLGAFGCRGPIFVSDTHKTAARRLGHRRLQDLERPNWEPDFQGAQPHP